MLKVASCVFDLYDDTNHEIARSLPAELHTVKVASVDEIQALADHEFGLVMKTASGTILRRYPVHDAEAFKLSAHYWERTKNTLPPSVQAIVDAKLAAAAAYLDGDEKRFADYKRVAFVDATKHAHATVADFPDKAFGLNLNGADIFPLHDADLVKHAEARFNFSTSTLNPHNRWKYARAIVKRASVLDVALPEQSPVWKYAADSTNLAALRDGIERRKKACKNVDTSVLDQLSVISGTVVIDGPSSVQLVKAARLAHHVRNDPVLFVSVLEAFDKLAGVRDMDYQRGHIPDPYTSVFAKTAGVTDGLFVDGVDLTKINPDELASKFDADFVREFLANPVEVYKSLPDPVKTALKQMAAKGGGIPMNPAPTAKSDVGSKGDPLAQLAPVFANGAAQTV